MLTDQVFFFSGKMKNDEFGSMITLFSLRSGLKSKLKNDLSPDREGDLINNGEEQEVADDLFIISNDNMGNCGTEHGEHEQASGI